MYKKLTDLKVKIFADGANLDDILALNARPYIRGFTTNPTLMKQAGVTDYEKFSHTVLEHIQDKPFSFEVFSDEFPEMERQAKKIASWGDNVNVKIPISNTKGQSSCELVHKLSQEGVKLNVTAIMTLEQVEAVKEAVIGGSDTIVSVFAGRIADTGRDPMPFMTKCREILSEAPNTELLWASPRELLNIFQADDTGCDIITVIPGILKKLEKIGYGLDEYSMDTVKMFYNDAQHAGYTL